MKEMISTVKRLIDRIFVNPHETNTVRVPIRVERKRPPFRK